MTADQERAFVLQMLQDNGGCQLPCWWGFTPGETSWKTAEVFFLSYGKRIDEHVSRSTRRMYYSVDFAIPDHDVYIGQTYIVSGNVIDMIWVIARTSRNGEIVYGDATYAEDLHAYMVPQILASYGKPEQVLIATYAVAPEPWIPFDMLLFYPDQGILARYYGPIENEERNVVPVEESIRMCPHRTEFVLWLWSPEDEVSLVDVAGTGLGITPEGLYYHRPLEEATGMSIDEFYEIFVQPGNQACLETPADLW